MDAFVTICLLIMHLEMSIYYHYHHHYYFLYPRVYNARRLKTERIKTAEMTRGLNVISEAIVQKHRIRSLYCNRQVLEKKAGLSLFSREATQPTSKLSQELQR